MRLWQHRVRRQPGAVTVRPAHAGDAEAVARMARDLSMADGGRRSRFTAESFLRDGFGDSPKFRAIVADEDGAAVGYAIYYVGYDTDTATSGVYLADLYVEEGNRRQGAGRSLMAAVATDCRNEGGRWMFWSVLRPNRGARRFYRTMAMELKDVIVCAAFGPNFDRLADGAE